MRRRLRAQPNLQSRLRPRLRLRQHGWHMLEQPGDYERRDWTPALDARRFECGSPNLTGTHGLEASLGLLQEVGIGAVQAAIEAFGKVDILVNNAGVVGFTPVASTELAEWNRVIGVNLTGVFLGIRAVAPALARAGGGVIVNISSTAGIMGYSNLSAYVASKWGVRGLTKAAALDLAKDGTRVVSVHPGGVRTPMTAGVASDDFYARQPIPRIGEPNEIAKLVLYLVADATYSTGTEFIADGGATVGQTLDV